MHPDIASMGLAAEGSKQVFELDYFRRYFSSIFTPFFSHSTTNMATVLSRDAHLRLTGGPYSLRLPLNPPPIRLIGRLFFIFIVSEVNSRSL